MTEKNFIVRKGITVSGDRDISEFKSKVGVVIPAGDNTDIGSGGDKPMTEEYGMKVGLTRTNKITNIVESVVSVGGVLTWKPIGDYKSIELHESRIGSNESIVVDHGNRISSNEFGIDDNSFEIELLLTAPTEDNEDPNTTLIANLLTDHINTPNSLIKTDDDDDRNVGDRLWYIKTVFYEIPSPSSDKSQTAISHDASISYVRSFSGGVWSEWAKCSSNQDLDIGSSPVFDIVTARNTVNIPIRDCILDDGGGIHSDAVDIIGHDTSSVIGDGESQDVNMGLSGVTGGGMFFGKNIDTASDWVLKSSLLGINTGLTPNTSDPVINANSGIIDITSTEPYAKSVIFDIADNWGYSEFMGVRSIEFSKNGVIIPITGYTSYATSELSSPYNSDMAFDENTSKIDSWFNNQWLSGTNDITNQRLIIVFDIPILFDEIIINNGHASGSSEFTPSGIKNTKISISTDAITDITYNNEISNSINIFDGIINQHIAENIADDQSFPVSYNIQHTETGVTIDNTSIIRMDTLQESVKSVIFDFKDNWGHLSLIGIRKIEFYLRGELIPLTATDISVVATSQLSTGYSGDKAFLTATTETGNALNNSWIGADQSNSDQRLVVAFTTPISFDKIVISNFIDQGVAASTGVKNTKITVSTDTITSIIYEEAITNSKLVFNGIVKIHTSADVEDPQVYLPTRSYKNIKSVVFDIADNWGGSNFISVRSIEFKFQGSIVNLTSEEYTSYATSIQDTYSSDMAFLSSYLKDGYWTGISWLSLIGEVINQRLIIVFSNPVTFDEIVINNTHNIGLSTDNGMKSTKISISTDEITDNTYDATITNSEIIFDGVIKQHIDEDIMDDQSYAIPNGVKPVTARTVSFDFEDNWGAINYMGIRSVEFLDINGDVIPITTGYNAYETSNVDSSYRAIYVFNTSLLKTGVYPSKQWLSSNGSLTRQRITIDFLEEKTFYGVRINNSHYEGSFNTMGVKNTKIWTSPDAITQTKAETYQDSTDMDLYWAGEVPKHAALDQVDDFNIIPQNGLEYLNTYINNKDEKTNLFGFGTTNVWVPKYKNVKSVVFDIADGWGQVSPAYLSLRSVEFKLNGSTLPLLPSDYNAYATTEPFDGRFSPSHAFDTTLSKVGVRDNTSMVFISGTTTNVRLIIVFNSHVSFDEVVINNDHNAGTNTEAGIKNVKITTSPNIITSTVYNEAVENGEIVFDGIIREHVPYDSPDDQYICSILGYKKVTARSVSFDITDTWGGGPMGLRSIEFLDRDGNPITINDYYVYATTYRDNSSLYSPYKTFDSSLSKSDSWGGTQWLSDLSVKTLQRVSIVFIIPITFYGIRINNSHLQGGITNTGIKNTKIYTSMDELTSLRAKSYQDIYNMELYWSGIVPEHALEDRADDFNIYIQNQWEFNPGNGFAQCVYEDSGVARQIPHPMSKKMISSWLKPLDIEGDWSVYSDKINPNQRLVLNSNAAIESSDIFSEHDPYSEDFIGVGTIGTGSVFLCAWFGDDLSNISQGMTGKEGAMGNIHSGDLTKTEYTDVKSVVFDIADNWGNANYFALRSIEFYLNGLPLDISIDDLDAYATTATNGFPVNNCLDRSISKVGDWIDTQWVSIGINPQRIIVVFKSPQIIDQIMINNSHHNGSIITSGIKNTIITISPDEVVNTTYATEIENGKIIFDGVISQHPETDTIDDQSYCLYDNSFDCGFNPECIIAKRLDSPNDWWISSNDTNWATFIELNTINTEANLSQYTLDVNGSIIDVPGEDDSAYTGDWLFYVFGRDAVLPTGASIQIKATTPKPFIASISDGFDITYAAKDIVVGFEEDIILPISDVSDGDHIIYINKDNTVRYDSGDLPIADITINDGIIVDMDTRPIQGEYRSEWFAAIDDTVYKFDNRFKSTDIELFMRISSTPDDDGIRSASDYLITSGNISVDSLSITTGSEGLSGYFKLIVRRSKI